MCFPLEFYILEFGQEIVSSVVLCGMCGGERFLR